MMPTRAADVGRAPLSLSKGARPKDALTVAGPEKNLAARETFKHTGATTALSRSIQKGTEP
jgi:hypothetical protein